MILADFGFSSFFTSRGDALDADKKLISPGRGQGTKLILNFAGTGSQSVSIQCAEPVEILYGLLAWSDISAWSHADEFSFSVDIGASAPTLANPAGTGNCNLVDAGGYNIIEPANGDGTHDIDVTDWTQTFPVPSLHNGSGVWLEDGAWDVDPSSGAIREADTPGKGSISLMDKANEFFIAASVSMGDLGGTFRVDPDKIRWVHQSWLMKMSINKVTLGMGDASAWIAFLREKTTLL